MWDIIISFLGDLILIVLPVKRKLDLSKEWSGTVERKGVFPIPTLSKYRYFVVFRTNNDNRKKLKMKKADFDRYHEGWRYIKKEGESLPEPHLG
jgi:hypothetical protein